MPAELVSAEHHGAGDVFLTKQGRPQRVLCKAFFDRDGYKRDCLLPEAGKNKRGNGKMSQQVVRYVSISKECRQHRRSALVGEPRGRTGERRRHHTGKREKCPAEDGDLDSVRLCVLTRGIG